MGKFKVWQVGESTPLKLAESNVGLEKNLESWIEADPTLLPGELEIISRQMIMDGGRLDLLALDPLGRCVVIEIKAGALTADVVTQAMYYAAQIDKYSFETLASKVNSFPTKNKKDLKAMLQVRGLDEQDFSKSKEVLIYLVGTLHTSGIDDMLNFMKRRIQVPLIEVIFDVFQLENGKRILVREVTEEDTPIARLGRATQKSTATIEGVCKKANQKGVGQEFRLILEESQKLGLHMRPYVRSIMYTHPDHKTRMLFTVTAHKKQLSAYIGYEAFVDYYSVTTEQVAEALGPSGWRNLDMEQAQQLVAGLEKLISSRDSGE
jgi:hypothetical protein